MTQGRQIGLGIAVGVVSAAALVIGFDVERSAANLGVASVVCVALAVALVELFSAPPYPGDHRR